MEDEEEGALRGRVMFEGSPRGYFLGSISNESFSDMSNKIFRPSGHPNGNAIAPHVDAIERPQTTGMLCAKLVLLH